MAAKVKWDREAWWIFTHHNRKRTKKRVGPTKAHKRQAEEIAKKINAALALGTFSMSNSTEKPIPCDSELRRWLRTYATTMKPSSEISARGLVEKHLVPHFGSTDLREIRESHLLQFAQAKVDDGLSPKTIQNALSILRRVLNLAMREGRVSRNPASRIGELMRRVDRRVAREVTEVETWSRGEIDTLLELAREHESRLYPALLFLFSTGARRGEMLGLRWEDVSFDRREISIRRAITARQLTTPKSGRSRIIAMSETLASELFDLLAERRREALARGWADTPPWIFCSEVGTAWEERNFERVWYRLRRRAQKAGIRPLKLHTTRHTWATLALQSGKSVRWVADQLGHADPALTLRTYAHALPEDEPDLSFVDFSSAEGSAARSGGVTKRRYASPPLDVPSDYDAQLPDFTGGPSGTRTLDPRVKSPLTRTKTP